MCWGVPLQSSCTTLYSHVLACAGLVPAHQVRKYIQKIAKPGIPLTQLCETLEDSVRNLIEARGLDAGV
jgi:methionyl aminopeptidase